MKPYLQKNIYRYERHCYDDDECEDNNGGCSQECKNTHGSYYCGCEDGYYLDNDRHTCKDLDECHPEDLPAAARSQGEKYFFIF